MQGLLVAATDPLAQAERAQEMFEKGPITAVAAFFCIAFFIALFLLLRAKDKHVVELEKVNAKNSEEKQALYKENTDRAAKLELALFGLLDLMDDIKVLAAEAKRTRELKEQRMRRTQSHSDLKPVSDGEPET